VLKNDRALDSRGRTVDSERDRTKDGPRSVGSLVASASRFDKSNEQRSARYTRPVSRDRPSGEISASSVGHAASVSSYS
jgi:hypothetical protein